MSQPLVSQELGSLTNWFSEQLAAIILRGSGA
jgi:hypothetical protein